MLRFAAPLLNPIVVIVGQLDKVVIRSFFPYGKNLARFFSIWKKTLKRFLVFLVFFVLRAQPVFDFCSWGPASVWCFASWKSVFFLGAQQVFDLFVPGGLFFLIRGPASF